MLKASALLALVLLLPACVRQGSPEAPPEAPSVHAPPPDEDIGPGAMAAVVVAVADGDTLTAELLPRSGERIKIRLYGIDSPEIRQPYGDQARQAAGTVLGSEVAVYPVGRPDRYGRTVALVSGPGPDNLNERLVQSGLAWVYPAYCKQADICDPLRDLEQAARAEKRGLWQEPAVPPWEWRKAHKRK